MLREALIWLPKYMENQAFWGKEFEHTPMASHLETLRGLMPILTEMRKRGLEENLVRSPPANVSHRFSQKGIVKFEPEASSVFDLRDGSTIRTAVTGDAVDSDVVFNLDKISDVKSFGYGQALRLWIHEAGHKLKAQKKNLSHAGLEALQAEIDEIAGYFGRHHSGQMILAGPLLALTSSPFDAPGQADRSPLRGYWPWQRLAKLWIVQPDGLIDLTESLHAQINALDRPHNSWDIDRMITGIQILDPRVDGEAHALLEIKNFRLPIDDSKIHFLSDIGGPLDYTAEVKINLREHTVEVLKYADDGPRLRRAVDAELEILEMNVAEDGTFKGRLDLTVWTKRNFHSGSYPIHRHGELIFYANGKSERVPIEMQAVMPPKERGWGGMPAEIYQQETHKRAHFSGKLPAGWPREFDVTGLIDDFFRLGSNEYEARPMLVTMKTPVHVTDCGGRLLHK